MRLLPSPTTRGPTVAPRAGRISKNQLVVRAVAAPELSPKEAGTAGAKNQLEALKQMSKIVADSGVRPGTCSDCYFGTLESTSKQLRRVGRTSVT